MITRTHTQLAQMTGAELLDLIAQQRQRHTGDLRVGDTTWRVYKSTCRGAHHGVWCNLWRERENGGTAPIAVHVRGMIDQRIGEMRMVER